IGVNVIKDDFGVFEDILGVTLEEWNESLRAKLAIKEAGGLKSEDGASNARAWIFFARSKPKPEPGLDTEAITKHTTGSLT
ncbi:hypothetical protein J0J29_23860, partial [Vibrio vulnificus]|uniref:hypothetical protein n=1 Tax=Vibrio vulnificus TaxID=672 RepID=UPI0019D4D91B